MPPNARTGHYKPNLLEKYPAKISSENMLSKFSLNGIYLCKISFEPYLRGFSVKCLNKMSSENPLEREIMNILQKSLANNFIGQKSPSNEMIINTVQTILRDTLNETNISNFKVELVQDSEEERLVREVLEEPLDPTLVRVNIFYDLPGQLDQITLQLPDELFLHHTDEKPE